MNPTAMDYISLLIGYLFLIVCLLVSVAFFTLLEQKFLGGYSVRPGPNKVGVWGLLQPFADAVKLFSKENMVIRVSNLVLYSSSPVMSMCFTIFLWLLLPLSFGGVGLHLGLFYFICVSGLGVFPVMCAGWSSNCKYSMLGSMRSIAQMVSYEVSMGVILLSLAWVAGSFNLAKMVEGGNIFYGIFIFFPVSFVWFCSMLAETNRTPFDFSEGESELVSGFNTEYSAGGFTLVFLSEYGNILFMSLFYSVIFLSASSFDGVSCLLGLSVAFGFIWARGVLPRFRYDKLMHLAWKGFLPTTLSVFCFLILFSF